MLSVRSDPMADDSFAAAFAAITNGALSAARIPIMATTIRSSISVKPAWERPPGAVMTALMCKTRARWRGSRRHAALHVAARRDDGLEERWRGALTIWSRTAAGTDNRCHARPACHADDAPSVAVSSGTPGGPPGARVSARRKKEGGGPKAAPLGLRTTCLLNRVNRRGRNRGRRHLAERRSRRAGVIDVLPHRPTAVTANARLPVTPGSAATPFR